MDNNKNYSRPKPRREPTKTELFTGQKHEYFTVFYNFALKKLLHIINDIDKQYSNSGEKRIAIKESNIINLEETPALISDKCYALLKDYMWRAFKDAKNTSGVPLIDDDKYYIAEFCKQLCNLRNFHSHYYHDNAALDFTSKAVKFIKNLYDAAKYANAETELSGLQMLDNKLKSRHKEYELFGLHDGQYKISADGRIFFLSFFLNKNEMHRLLDSVQKSKEGKELTNKVFRKILTYYCHRGGVERFKYNQEENVLSILSPDLQDSIQQIRQAYKIVSYLNNVPGEITDIDNFPLIFELTDKKIVPTQGNAAGFIKIAANEGLFNGYNISAKDVTVYKETKAKGGVNAKKGKPVRTFGNKYNLQVVCILKDGLFIHISPKDFHRLIVYALNHKQVKVKREENVMVEISGEQYITETWDNFFLKRNLFTEYIQNLPATIGKVMSEEETNLFKKEWNSHSFFWKGIDNGLKIKLEGYFLQRIKGSKNQQSSKQSQIENIKLEAIDIRFVDIFHQRDEILRNVNQFTRFAVQYIIDFNLLPNWYWQHEKYEIEKNKKGVGLINKRQLEYCNTRQTKTISVDSNLQAIAVCMLDGETLAEAQKHKFVFGPAALRNIILYAVQEKDSKDFLPQLRTELVNPVNENNKLVTAGFLSAFQLGKTVTKEEILKKAAAKINTLAEQLKNYEEQIKANVFNMKRNDKNRVIMELYQLYNWQADTRNGKDTKFLRKNQYQQMSVYHYYLQAGKLDALIADFNYMIPAEIKKLLQQATSIDHIFELLVNDVLLQIIPAMRKQVNDLLAIDDATLDELCRKLHIKKIDSHSREAANKINIPYDVHPLQVIMYHEHKTKEQLKTFGLLHTVLKAASGVDAETGKTIYSFKPAFTQGLKMEYYQTQGYINYLQKPHSIPIDNGEAVARYRKTLSSKLRGDTDAIQVQDMLLWYMAGQYIKANNGRAHAHQITITDVGNIRKSIIEIPVTIEGATYYVSLFYHQIDDLLFIETSDYLQRMSSYHVRQQAYLNMGVDENKIEYSKLYEEYNVLQNQSLSFSKLLMFWEKELFYQFKDNEIAELEVAKKGMKRIDFDAYCKKRDPEFDNYLHAIKEDKEAAKYNLSFQLNRLKYEIRNTAFHANIPANYVYPQLNKNTFVVDELVQPYEDYLAYHVKEKAKQTRHNQN